MHWRVAS
ncbi:hypothetical protein CGLO_02332 [Colletotrichum gloeosporioides Cg-14]|nr:hypothetical protein CGLO_02332 [Colletotrichum gloeosporioides Cg-14]